MIRSYLATVLRRAAAALERGARRPAAAGAAQVPDLDGLRQVFATMSEGVLVAAPDDTVRLVNEAFCRAYRLGRDLPEDLVGRRLAEVGEGTVIAGLVEAARTAGRVSSADVALPPPGRRHLTLLASPLPAGDGVVVVARDVTEAVRLAEARRDLVANVSHELKTPLTAIRGYAETLEDGALLKPEVARRFTGRILGQCQRLEALLADLLTLSRMESQEPGGVAREPQDLARLTQEAIEVLAPRAREREVRVQLAVETPTPAVVGSGAELERLLLNLIENAIKYNRPGGEVAVRLSSAAEGVLLEVRDTGIGIPASSLERIFERFYRVDKARARHEGGTGLGLAIVKHVALGHGGSVEVESTLGRGSMFRVRLPRQGP